MERGAAARFRLDEILSLSVDVEVHVASTELDDGVRLRGCVVHEIFFLLDGFGGRQSLLGANLIECDENCGVDGVRDVE